MLIMIINLKYKKNLTHSQDLYSHPTIIILLNNLMIYFSDISLKGTPKKNKIPPIIYT